MGTPGFAVPSLRSLVAGGYDVIAVYTQPDRPSGRGRRLFPPAAKLAALELGLHVEQPESLRRGGAIELLRELAPELIVVAAYGQILRPAVIDLPPHGCVNVHASLLPRHRGASAIAASILAGDTETGISIMLIDAGMDTGPVLSRRATPIGDRDTTATLTERLSQIGAGLLLETLPGWLAGNLKPEPQDARRATLAPMLTKGIARIDWQKPAAQIAREVRAYNPWPLSTATFDGETVQLLDATPAEPVSPGERAEPGAIVESTHEIASLPADLRRSAAFGVQCGGGLLLPLRLRRAGRNAVSGAEFARGMRNLAGSRFS